jgi:hypothetical protein
MMIGQVHTVHDGDLLPLSFDWSAWLAGFGSPGEVIETSSFTADSDEVTLTDDTFDDTSTTVLAAYAVTRTSILTITNTIMTTSGYVKSMSRAVNVIKADVPEGSPAGSP